MKRWVRSEAEIPPYLRGKSILPLLGARRASTPMVFVIYELS